MRIDMPCCDFRLCRRYFDGNCNATENGINTCEYRLMQDAIRKVSEMNEYKIVGITESYCQYNEGWQDSVDKIKALALME